MRVLESKIYPIRDDEAYYERLAIVEEADPSGSMDSFRIANQAGCGTRYSVVATEALKGDWVPLMSWCVELAQRFGSQAAVEIWFEIQVKVEKEKEWRLSLKSK